MLKAYAPLAALGLFAGICFLVVFAFTLYHLNLISKNKTTNEIFKWEDAEEAFRNGDVEFFNRHKLKQEASTLTHAHAAKLRGNASPRNHENTEVDDMTMPESIENIYNRGIVANFKEIMFPRKL